MKTIKQSPVLVQIVATFMNGKRYMAHAPWWLYVRDILHIYSVGLFMVALLMGLMAYYAADHLSALYVADRMRSIVDLGNGNFSSLDAQALGDLTTIGNFESATPGHWPSLLAKTYTLIEYSILACLFSCLLFSTLGVYKGGRSLYDRYFSFQATLREALNNNSLMMHYQPIVDMTTGQWIGAEALLRWSVKGQPVSPGIFIPLMEKSGMMKSVTRWVCERVIDEYASMMWACDSFYVTINLSSEDVMDPTFPDFIAGLLDQYQVQASRITFEVTEGTMLNRERASVQLNRLRAQGHLIALDDFGTGYCNLSYLAYLPVDIIKIDRSFVVSDHQDQAHMILSHIVDIARKLKLKVIVEGVETPRQVECVTALGARVAQGWHYSRELPADALVRGYFSVTHPMINTLI